jgi:hypothetical protein
MELLIIAVVSLLVQAIKNWLGTNRLGTIALLLAISFFAAGVQMLLQNYGLWEGFLQIALGAAGVWSILIKGFEKE